MTMVVLQPQRQSRAFVSSWQGVSNHVIRDTKLVWQFFTRELWYAQPPEGWTPKLLLDGRCAVWKVHKAMLGLRTSPRRCQEHLSSKLKEHGFSQDERDPCLFMNEKLDVCIGVHVDDMLAVGPSEPTKNAVAGTREGHGDALGHGDREAARDSGSVLEQDNTRVQLRSLVLVSA